MRNFKNLAFPLLKSSSLPIRSKLVNLRMTNMLKQNFCSKVQQDSIKAIEGRLDVRNSETLQLKLLLDKNQETISIQVPKTGNLNDIAIEITEKLKVSSKISFICNDGFFLPEFTPIEALLNRNFFIFTGQQRHIPIFGQFQQVNSSNFDQTIKGLQNLQFPAYMRNEIIDYIRRVDTCINLKYSNKDINKQYHLIKQADLNKSKNSNPSLSNISVNQAQQSYKDLDNVISLPQNQAKKILIEALLDPTPQDRGIIQVQAQFTKLYWEIEQMKDLKMKAQQQCRNKVRKLMATGLALIGANIGFIWAGTYVIWSWDIIQPIAYFIDAGAGIILTYQFFKMGKMYSHLNYQEYIFKKYLKKSYQNVGFDENKYAAEILKLKKMQSIIKDHYIRKLS